GVVEAMVAYLVERATHKLRGHGAVARSVAVRVLYVDTRPDARADAREGAPASRGEEGPAAAERRAKLCPPSDSTDAILQHVLALWRALPRRRALVKRVGLTLVDLAPAGGWQRHLFSEGPGDEAAVEVSDATAGDATARESREDRQRRLDRALDLVRERHGFGRILRGKRFALKATH